ncbi:MAG: hypothetical protein V5A84_02175 [Planctomycetota bacterium]
MLEKISACILVLSLALNFAIAGLWASGGLERMLRPRPPERHAARGSRRGHGGHDRGERHDADIHLSRAPRAGGAVSRALVEVWRGPERCDDDDDRRGDCDERGKDARGRDGDCDRRASASRRRAQSAALRKLRILRGRGWQIW